MSAPTEREARQFVSSRAYAEIVASPQWETVEKELLDEIAKAMETITSIVGSDREHDAITEIRNTKKVLKTFRDRAAAYWRLKEKLAKENPMPDEKPIANFE